MNTPLQYLPVGRSAREIAASVESAVRHGELSPGDQLPAVRRVAGELGISPSTVAAAYRELHRRGIVAGVGRGGTRVRSRPPVRTRLVLTAPPGTRNLVTGWPDPELLPALPPVRVPHRLYGEPPVLARLGELAAARLEADGISARNLAVVSGALDGVERVLAAWLAPGDRVIVEDPGHAGTHDLVAAMSFQPVPVPMDELGVRPAELAEALDRGAEAVILTPRAQAATGAAWDPERAGQLREVLGRHPGLVVIEDDHAGPVAGVPPVSACAGLGRWAVLRSVSKSLGPDLRVAVLAGDEATVSRVEGRQALGAGWVSYQLQAMVAELWADRPTGALLANVAATYAARRQAMQAALARHGITASGRSGLSSWIAVADEGGVAAALLTAGWAVGVGERFRIAAPPGIRVCYSTLAPAEATSFADELARILRQRPGRAD
jgi:DNA-binding transcriptional MocR family regulator